MAEMYELRWEDPPQAPGRPPFDVDDPAFQQLRENPKRWARLIDFKSAGSAQSRASTLRRRLGAEFEFTGRKLGEGAAVFGRYVGPQQG